MGSDGKRPTEDGKWPTEDRKRPTEDGKRPTEDRKRPTQDGKRPTEEGLGPTGPDGTNVEFRKRVETPLLLQQFCPEMILCMCGYLEVQIQELTD